MMDVQVEAREFPVFETWDALWAYLRIAPVGAMADLRLPDAKMPEEWLRELWDDAGFPANGWGSTASALRTAWAADDAEYRRRERNLLNLAIITKAELLYRGKPVDGPLLAKVKDRVEKLPGGAQASDMTGNLVSFLRKGDRAGAQGCLDRVIEAALRDANAKPKAAVRATVDDDGKPILPI